MSTSARLPQPGVPGSHAVPGSLAWRQELHERVMEHRQRRADAAKRADTVLGEVGPGSSRVAERVANRFRAATSYEDWLAESTREVAAQERMPWEPEAAGNTEIETGAGADAGAWPGLATAGDFRSDHAPVEAMRLAQAAAQVDPANWGHDPMRKGQPCDVQTHVPLPARMAAPARAPRRDHAPTSSRALVDAFAEAMVPAAQALPAKLIEFPRELVAPRKQRPRLAEGPLLEQEAPPVALRIFEVEMSQAGQSELPPEQAPEMRREAAAGSMDEGTPALRMDRAAEGRGQTVTPSESERAESMPRRRGGFEPGGRQASPQGSGWGSIRLGEHPQAESTSSQADTRVEQDARPLQDAAPALQDLAPVSARLMGALVDSCIVGACFLLSALTFVACTVQVPGGKAAAAAGLLGFGVLAVFYGWLFMSYGGGSTPGMRYARIALCTFTDENPRRKDLRNRVPATALALLPLGLGVLWALLDEDRLGWQDRMTRTYQRSYR